MVRTEELHVWTYQVVRSHPLFEAKGVSRKCPSCGHETCDLIDEARADVHFALPGFKFGGYDIGRADMLGLFVLACEECGFVRLYHRSVIAAWIERNPYSSTEI